MWSSDQPVCEHGGEVGDVLDGAVQVGDESGGVMAAADQEGVLLPRGLRLGGAKRDGRQENHAEDVRDDPPRHGMRLRVWGGRRYFIVTRRRGRRQG